MPKRAGEMYHIIAIDWWNDWMYYTRYDKIKLEMTNDSTIADEATTAEIIDELEIEKLHIHKEASGDLST
jgi:hypothetical protein